MAINVHIEHIADTLANIWSNMDLLQIGILTDNNEEFVWANADKSKVFVAASQYEYNGSVAYSDVDFGTITMHGDIFVDEYIKLNGASNNRIRFQTDQVGIDAGGVNGISIQDDKVLINSAGITGFETQIYASNTDTNALLVLNQAGTGDATIQQTAGASWFLGPDNDNNDTYKVGTTEGFGSNVFLSILSGGNVGIGTTTPGTSPTDINVGLDVDFSANSFIRSKGSGSPGVQAHSTTGSITTKIQSLAGAYGYIGTESNHDCALVTNNAPVIYMKNSGNVGIGTTTPNSKLSVNGSINQEERVYKFTKEYSVAANGSSNNVAVITFRLPTATEYFTAEVVSTNTTNSTCEAKKSIISGKLVSNVYTEYDATVIHNSGSTFRIGLDENGSNNDLEIRIANDGSFTATGMSYIKIILNTAGAVSYQSLTYETEGT